MNLVLPTHMHMSCSMIVVRDVTEHWRSCARGIEGMRLHCRVIKNVNERRVVMGLRKMVWPRGKDALRMGVHAGFRVEH